MTPEQLASVVETVDRLNVDLAGRPDGLRIVLEIAPVVSHYPVEIGDDVALGPGVIARADGSLINWRGRNYVPDDSGGVIRAARKMRDLIHGEYPITSDQCDAAVDKVVTAVDRLDGVHR